MTTRIPESCAPVNALPTFESELKEAQAVLRQTMERRIGELLAAIVSHVVGRPYHQRRATVPQELRREGRCCQCGSRASCRFSRNGFRLRHLLFSWGEVIVPLPRVRCVCGGSVQIDFGDLLRPYQRIWEDIDAQIRRWAALTASLRQMQQEAAYLGIGALALRTLNQRLHQLIHLDPERQAQDVPPILQVDALWLTVMDSKDERQRDRAGRQRPVTERAKRPLFVALGVWPESDRCEVLHWYLGHSESAEEAVKFLETLEAQGIRHENGLQLIIHDGGKGLVSALQTVWFGAKEQRCLFHKQRNLYAAIRAPEGLTDKQRRRHRKKVLRDFRAIWAARQYSTMLRRYLKVVRRYRQTQPEAVATLRRDFRSTVTYYQLEREFPTWERRHLRTTSRLERFNRRLRRRIRAANAYHSETGVYAMITHEAQLFHTRQRRT